jgi:hypothetical protein
MRERSGKENQLIVARSVEEMECLRPIWEASQSHPNADMDYFLTVLASRPEVIRPHVVCLHKNGRAEALIVGRIEDVHLECRFGYKTVCRFPVRALSVVYGGVMGNMSEENCHVLVEELICSLKRREAEVIYWSNLRTDSTIYEKAIRLPRFLSRDYFVNPNNHWRLALPQNLEEYYKNVKYKARKNLRRTVKLLSERNMDPVSIQCFRTVRDLDRFMEQAEAIAGKTYQRGLGAGFFDNEENRRLLTLAAERGWLRSYILYIGDQPISFDTAIQYGDTFYLQNGGYDPEYRQYDPGTNLFLRYLEDLCADPLVRYVDFGFGDAEYKQNLCNESWKEASVYVFASNFTGLKLNLIRSALAASHHYGSMTLRRMRLYERVKREWRQWMRQKSNCHD